MTMGGMRRTGPSTSAATAAETTAPGGEGDGAVVVVLFYRYFPGPVHSLLLPRVAHVDEDGDERRRQQPQEEEVEESAGRGGDEDGSDDGEQVQRPRREPLSLLRDRIRTMCRSVGVGGSAAVSECTSSSSSHDEKKEEGQAWGFGNAAVSRASAATMTMTMRGRILLSAEGINGTLSAPCRGAMDQFIRSMEEFDLTQMLAEEEGRGTRARCSDSDGIDEGGLGKIFAGIDWKVSSHHDDNPACRRTRRPLQQPFPDLKISLVKEIVSSGGTVTLSDLERYRDDRQIRHLSPEQFHEALRDDGDGVALIDVRNTFEYSIGRFYDSAGNEAIDPRMTKFSSFDDEFVSDPRTADLLREKKRVLMYCTGGIRCEKASVMLRRFHDHDGGGALEGKEICVLEGGIHRYLEKYGSDGFFRGKNFVFDQRVAVAPASLLRASSADTNTEAQQTSSAHNDRGKMDVEAGRLEADADAGADSDANTNTNIIVGRCIECSHPHDELSGAIVCSVCRDLVLVCPSCRAAMREYHCARHAYLKDCYYTFLQPYGRGELEFMLSRLVEERERLLQPQPMPRPANGGGGGGGGADPPTTTTTTTTARHKNVRRTLLRQINKVRGRIDEIDSPGTGGPPPDPDCPRRCRTCWSSEDECDGLCWGFWKRSRGGGGGGGSGSGGAPPPPPPLPIEVGDEVEPGPDWNGLKLGDKSSFLLDGDGAVTGRVVERKSWGSSGGGDDAEGDEGGAGCELDCVAVVWEERGGPGGPAALGGVDGASERNTDAAAAAAAAPASATKKKVAPSRRRLRGRPEIYRWGVVAPNGKRMYDVQRKTTTIT